jgi:hypothetical protein
MQVFWRCYDLQVLTVLTTEAISIKSVSIWERSAVNRSGITTAMKRMGFLTGGRDKG